MDGYKSTSGYVFLAGDAAITWGSQKQATIALSLTKAEYVALSESSCEIMWLRHLYGELGYIQKQPTLLLGDNDGSIAMAQNPQFHKQSKHVNIRWHWVGDLVQDGLVNIQDCQDLEQTADILTKTLQQQKHNKHTKSSAYFRFEGECWGACSHIIVTWERQLNKCISVAASCK